MIFSPSSIYPTTNWRSAGPGRSWCLLFITGLVALGWAKRYGTPSAASATKRVTACYRPGAAAWRAKPKVYVCRSVFPAAQKCSPILSNMLRALLQTLRTSLINSDAGWSAKNIHSSHLALLKPAVFDWNSLRFLIILRWSRGSGQSFIMWSPRQLKQVFAGRTFWTSSSFWQRSIAVTWCVSVNDTS